MARIWKYEFEISDADQVKEMPCDAKLLHVGMQSGLLCMWALVPEHTVQKRTFHVVGTGHFVSGEDTYIGTVQAPPFVWHLFEKVTR